MPDRVDALTERILQHTEEARVADQPAVVLIDGRSGSGKTTLSRRLSDAWPAHLGPVRLVHLDDVYPGWHGLEAASEAVPTTILRGTPRGWRRWDWQLDRPGEWAALDPAVSVIVEGAGSVTRASSALATTRVWLELDRDERRRRALARDGAAYEPWWDVWAEQEEQHLARHAPRTLADIVVDA